VLSDLAHLPAHPDPHANALAWVRECEPGGEGEVGLEEGGEGGEGGLEGGGAVGGGWWPRVESGVFTGREGESGRESQEREVERRGEGVEVVGVSGVAAMQEGQEVVVGTGERREEVVEGLEVMETLYHVYGFDVMVDVDLQVCVVCDDDVM
jgi:hypothetical protein